jgi:hypothetical protein
MLRIPLRGKLYLLILETKQVKAVVLLDLEDYPKN